MQCGRLRDKFSYSRQVFPTLFPISDWYTYLNGVDDNKTKIAKSGALVPLTRLARSKDMRVQRNATGALLNMTHSGTQKFVVLVGSAADN
jgi:hypothetical protein